MGRAAVTVKALAGISMMSQCSCLHTALSCGACRRSSGAIRPTALAMGRIPLRTKEGSFGRRKCLGRSRMSGTNSLTLWADWPNRGVGQMLPGVADGGACDRMISVRLFAKELLTSGWMSVLPMRLTTVSRDHTLTPMAWDCTCSRERMLNWRANGGCAWSR